MNDWEQIEKITDELATKNAEIARLTQLIAEAALAIPECSGTLRERILILKTHHSAEITKLTAERDALRDKLQLAVAHDDDSIRACLAMRQERDALRVRNAEHEQFRHQHRDCDKLGCQLQALRSEVDQHVGTIEVLDAELRRAKGMASRADGA
jgi:hypothetical protein